MADHTLRTGGPGECQGSVLPWQSNHPICAVETPLPDCSVSEVTQDCFTAKRLPSKSPLSQCFVCFSLGCLNPVKDFAGWVVVVVPQVFWKVFCGPLNPLVIFIGCSKEQGLLGVSSFFTTRSVLHFRRMSKRVGPLPLARSLVLLGNGDSRFPHSVAGDALRVFGGGL